MFSERSVSAGGVYCRRQCTHSRRTRRCATTPTSADAITYGSAPMSISRVTTDGASSVCSVDSTRWPVCAACIAIFAVSRVADLADAG